MTHIPLSPQSYTAMTPQQRHSYESQLFSFGADEVCRAAISQEDYPTLYALLSEQNSHISMDTITGELLDVFSRGQIQMFEFLSHNKHFTQRFAYFEKILPEYLIKTCMLNDYKGTKTIIEIEKQKSEPRLQELLTFNDYRALRLALQGAAHMSHYDNNSYAIRSPHPLDALFAQDCLSFQSPAVDSIIKMYPPVCFLEEIQIAQEKRILNQMVEVEQKPNKTPQTHKI